MPTLAPRLAAAAVAVIASATLAVIDRPNPIIQAVESAQQRCKLPGVAACVFTRDEIVGTVFMGVRTAGSPEKIRIDDRFALGSCGKAMTAMVAAKAVEDGAISWETTLGDALPDLAKDTPYAGVTLRQLLTHRAGVAALTDDETELFRRAVTQAPDDPRAARRHLTGVVLAEPPANAPGADFIYSNAGYAIATAMVEQAAGDSFESLMLKHVFRPLGMDRAILAWPTGDGRTDAARGHRAQADQRTPEPPDHADDSPALAPAGGVSSSIEDFARFGIAHLRGLDDKPGALTPDSFRTLHTPSGDEKYAMGWFVRPVGGAPVHYHDGGTGWYSAAVMLDPAAGVGVVVLTNTGGGQDAGGDACQSICTDLIRAARQAARRNRAG